MTNKITQSSMCEHGFYGNIFWREHHLIKKGNTHKGHKHIIDHATIIIKGSVDVVIDNTHSFIASAPCVLEIDKDKFHQFTAREDDTIYFCIFATNELEKTLEESENIKINQTDFFAKTLCSDCSGCN